MRVGLPTLAGLIGCLTSLLAASTASLADPLPVPPPDPPGAYLFRVYQYAYLHPEIAGKSDDELLSEGYAACRIRGAHGSAQAAGVNPYIYALVYALATIHLCAIVSDRG